MVYSTILSFLGKTAATHLGGAATKSAAAGLVEKGLTTAGSSLTGAATDLFTAHGGKAVGAIAQGAEGWVSSTAAKLGLTGVVGTGVVAGLVNQASEHGVKMATELGQKGLEKATEMATNTTQKTIEWATEQMEKMGQHKPNDKAVEGNGTPEFDPNCPDCQAADHGHVTTGTSSSYDSAEADLQAQLAA